jgi:hypothetical protein
MMAYCRDAMRAEEDGEGHPSLTGSCGSVLTRMGVLRWLFCVRRAAVGRTREGLCLAVAFGVMLRAE